MRIWAKFRVWIISAALGGVLGCIMRFAFGASDNRRDHATYLMTIAFIVIVPLVMGYVSAAQYLRTTRWEAVRWWAWLFLPWLSVLITALVAVALKWEGVICLIFAGPVMLVMSLIGGLAARIEWGIRQPRAGTTLSATVLPLLVLLIEIHTPQQYQIRDVSTEIAIRAPASVVWKNIERVSTISPRELPASWINVIGFPKPVQATLSHEGVGSVRQASFTGGLAFTETVNRWDERKDLRFSIRANTDSIPPTTLDEHVTVGGAFFDVLDGEYRLEQRPDGILLHLTSRERLSTHLNPYAGLWSDAVMRAIQEQILQVIRARCEAEGAVASQR